LSDSRAKVIRIIVQGAANGAFAVSRETPLVVGRGAGAKIWVNDRRVSRAHCRIEIGEHGLEVADLDSANGTFVNGHLVMRAPLHDGDELRVGDAALRVSIETEKEHPSPSGESVFDREFACRDCGRSIALATFAEGEVLEVAGRFVCPSCARREGEAGLTAERRIVEQLLADGFIGIERLPVAGTVPIFRAKRTALGQPVTIKALAPQKGVSEKLVLRFLREARIVARLNHPNIVRVFDVRRSGKILYIVMESIEGRTLLEEIEARGRLEVRRALAVALPVARALDHAHSLGVIHRDLKPANVMITEAAEVKLIDFGLAKMLRTIGDRSVTLPGEALGTLAYAAPEQLRDAGQVDERADIFAFGATLHHALCGKPPYPGAREPDQEPDLLERYAPATPKEVLALVARCLAIEPAARFGTMADLCVALEDAIRRVHGFPLGRANVDVLVHFERSEKPARPDEATRRMPAFAAPGADAPLPASGFLGLFTQTELFELFQMIEQNQKSGRLEISDPPGRKGVVVLREGKIVRASYREREAAEAVMALLELEEGHFRFLSQPVEDAAGEAAIAIGPLLLEGMRRRDEQARGSPSETIH
jgi:serine/threonine protein kinase